MPIIRQDGSVAQPENPERRGFSREDFVGGSSPSPSQSVHPQPQRLSGEIRPADLRGYDGPLFVINNMASMISHDDGKGNVLRVEAVHSVEHIAVLPIEVAQHPGFQKLWRTGRIKVSTDPNIENTLSLMSGPEDMGGILPYTLDAGQNKDLTPIECLICQETVFLSKEDQDAGTPALCDGHIDSVGLIEQVRDVNGHLVWKIRDNVVRRHDTATTVVGKRPS